MIRGLLAAVMFAAAMLPARGWAAPVRVTSGEHDGFTRLVLQFPAATDWTVVRTDEGYELRTAEAMPVYDLSRVFDLIGRQRVAAVWADPVSGAFRVGVACACHALPFALRPDVVVIDIRDGPPPEGWGFEAGADGQPMPPLMGGKAAPPVAPPPWDWRDMALGGRWAKPEGPKAEPVEAAPAPPLPPLPAMAGLEAALVAGLARAASQGLVDPVEKLPQASGALAETGQVAVHLGTGVDSRSATDPPPKLSADGAQCPGEARLAVQDWGDDRPIHEQMADATASLSGEFDRTRPEALERAVRFQLFLGFGAEARALLRAFGGNLPDAALWRGLSYLLDGGTDPEGPFRGLEACDDPAALWATVADPALGLTGVNRPALLRSFSALPPHLRVQIGPMLAERFLQAGDTSTAQALSDSVLRPALADDQRKAQLMQARLAITAGDAAAADRLLGPLLADPGPLAQQVIATRIDLAALTGAPVAQDSLTVIEAMLREADAEMQPVLHRALVLAFALSGDFAAAFDQEDIDAATKADLWRLLAQAGGDEAVLEHALPVATEDHGDADPETRRKMAQRLLDLGFYEAAAGWGGGQDPILRAEAALALGKPAEVLSLLGPADGAAAQAIKARALLQTDAAAAVAAFDGLGDADAARAAAIRARLWPEVAQRGDGAWGKLVESLSPVAGPEAALARGRALAGQAEATGAAIEALLSSVPVPPAQ